MAFEEVKENAEHIKENFQLYVDQNIDYLKLKAFKILTQSSITVLHFLILTGFILFFLLFASLALAFGLSNYFDNYAIGFLIVAGFYLIVTFLFLCINKNFLEKPLLTKFSKIFFKE